jgi:hypothetical protein
MPLIISAGPFCIDAGVQVILPKVNKGGIFYGGAYIDSSGKFSPIIAGGRLAQSGVYFQRFKFMCKIR